MLISYNWLKKYFESDLPSAETIADKLIFHAFEVEEVKKINDDYVIDIKILPDRAHDCLCHYGIAKEISALFDLPLKQLSRASKKDSAEKVNKTLEIKIEDEKLCRRYIGRVVENIEVRESPEWLQKLLKAMGQRPINNIVDIANYIMFDIGQPIHAFDADKLEGGIIARFARDGEKLITLDNQSVELDNSVFILSDDKDPLGIAGVKGGKKAETTFATKKLVLEAANFDPVLLRKSSQKVGIRTDASKRFENELSTETANWAMDILTEMIVEVAGSPQTIIGPKVDVYPQDNMPTPTQFPLVAVSETLGVDISKETVLDILRRLNIEVEIEGDMIKVVPPMERLDLVSPENYFEEIGRVYGYDKIVGRHLAKLSTGARDEVTEKRFAVANKIKEILVGEGFSEVYGYAFTDKGNIKLANPLASDKGFLRATLLDWLEKKVDFNSPYLLFDNEAVKIFEIGTVFLENGKEEMRLGIGVGTRKKIKGFDAKNFVDEILEKLAQIFNCPLPEKSAEKILADTYLCEISFDWLAEATKDFTKTELLNLVKKEIVYKPISSYPRIVRDVAVWVPVETEIKKVIEVIKATGSVLLTEEPILFDEYQKDNKKSLAFRLVFQSYEKTLSDEEANGELDKIINLLEKEKEFEVRK